MISSVEEGLLLVGILLALVVLEYQRRRGRRLSRRLSSLGRQLEKMREELAELQSDRLELLSAVSGTFEDPLEEILDEVEAMSRPGERDPAGVKRGLTRLRKAAAALSRQRETLSEIDHLRTVALGNGGKSGEGSGPPEGWDGLIPLDELLSEAIQSCAEDLRDKRMNLTVAMDEEVMVRGSRDYLTKAMRGILCRTVSLAPVESILSVTLEVAPPSAELRITYRGQPRGGAGRMELSEELARQVLITHGGWLRQGRKQGEYQAGIPLD